MKIKICQKIARLAEHEWPFEGDLEIVEKQMCNNCEERKERCYETYRFD